MQRNQLSFALVVLNPSLFQTYYYLLLVFEHSVYLESTPFVISNANLTPTLTLLAMSQAYATYFCLKSSTSAT